MWFQNENVVRLSYVPKQDMSGWWFQTYFIFHFIYGNVIIPTDKVIFFKIVIAPPTRCSFIVSDYDWRKLSVRPGLSVPLILIFSRQNGHHKNITLITLNVNSLRTGKSPFFHGKFGKSTISTGPFSIANFVCLPEGNSGNFINQQR